MFAWILLLIFAATALAYILGLRSNLPGRSKGDHSHDEEENENLNRKRNKKRNKEKDREIEEQEQELQSNEEEQETEEDEEIKEETEEEEEIKEENEEEEEIKTVEVPLEGALSEERRAWIKRAEDHLSRFEAAHEESVAIKLAGDKIKSMGNLDVSGYTKETKKEHDNMIIDVVRNNWENQYTQRHLELSAFVHGLYNLSRSGENLDEELKNYPLFEEYLENSNELIINTSEKYGYYNLFIRKKIDEISKKIDSKDPRIEEMKKIDETVYNLIKNTNMSLNDYLELTEKELKKLEKIEKTLITKKEAKPKNAKTELVTYQKSLSESTSGNLEERIADKIDKMNTQGIIKLGEIDQRDRAFLIEKGKRMWAQKIQELMKQTNALIRKTDLTKDCKELLEQKPTESFDKWLNGSEFMFAIPITLLKFNEFLKFRKEMEKIASDEELPESFVEKLENIVKELGVQVLEETITVDEFEKACSNILQSTKKKIKEDQEQKASVIQTVAEYKEEEIAEEKGLIVSSKK